MDIEGLRNVQKFVKRSIKKQESADASDNSSEQLDGGPGSGNWGHAGRPGHEGGSASGGGKQFRLDKPGGGYTGLVWAYRANEAFNKGGEKALIGALNVPAETMAKKSGGSGELKSGEQSGSADDRFSQERKDKATWDEPQIEIHESLVEHAGEEWNSFTPDQKEALYRYTGNSYESMNEALREGSYRDGTCWDKTAKMIDDASEALDITGLNHDVWAQRGISGFKGPAATLGISEELFTDALNDENALAKLKDAVLDHDVTQNGFTSTSPAKGEGFGGMLILNCYVPKGSKAIYAEPFSANGFGKGKGWDGKDYDVTEFGEFELLIQRGAKFHFTKIEVKNGKMYADVDVYTPDLKDIKKAEEEIPMF